MSTVVVGWAIAALLVPVATTVSAQAQAAGSVRSAISLRGPVSGTYGTTINLTGILWRHRTSVRIPGATVYLQRATHGKNNWTTFKSTKTSRTGTFTFSVVQGRPYDYRARWSGSSTYTTAVSGRVYPAVAQKIIIDKIYEGDVGRDGVADIGLRARVYPVPPFESQAVLQRWDPAQRRWGNIAIGGTQHHLGRNVIEVWSRARVGRAWYRVQVRARGQLAAGYTRPVPIPVYRRRGLYSRPLLAEGASGASAGSRWVVRDTDLVSAPVYPGTQRWVEIRTATCSHIRVGASADDVTVAPHFSVVADGRQLFAGRMRRTGSYWSISAGLLDMKGASRTRITVTNPHGSVVGEFGIGAYGACYT